MIGKRQKLPKVTDLFKTMPNKRVKPSEENKAEEFQAKSIRIVPHQEGQWATFVYIKPPSEFCSKLIKTQQTILLPLLSENFPELSYDFSEADSLHISLSRTLYLKHYQLESFKANLQKQISNIERMAEIITKKLVFLVNQEKTKIFIGLEATTESTYLLELSNACDRAISDELKGLPEPELAKILFFKEPTFHFTLVSVNFVDPEEKEQITQLCDRLKKSLASVKIKERSFQLSDEKVRLKMGDQIYQL
ncbi:hypothetical protein FGO68_gene6453 [Halteria grandinella]|uniref:U6 snRNA phosphodiesterase 1 n=1 Tax=Halteria grandinella TaxID=5974 RepID=A0A8J8SYX5_HALGN|nr:hypothetical protein FGO68_gene6453 [Halteria grandinella]